MPTSPRLIKRLLVANRGEIATRILSAARELNLETIAVYTDNDIGHTYNATHALRLSSPASYLSIDELVKLAVDNRADAVHLGYGFLSESADFARRMGDAGVLVVGPGPDILDRTGDKLAARLLAEHCGVPVLPALTRPTGDVETVREFAASNGFPVMVKAVDGGGGRGIRLVRQMEDLQSLTTRAIEESPSKAVFVERAAVEGFRHVEVQIVGDAEGNVMHLWERECSIQRRYQKVVETAPSLIDREVIRPVIEAAVKMAEEVKYKSLGTFEFLLNSATKDFFFLEINPRLQVEHTITESICNTDIVKAQLRLAQGASPEEAGLGDLTQDPLKPPSQHSIQLRVTAEDPERNWTLSTGKITSFNFPSGAGVRVDTALVHGAPATVTADFDSVIAKLIVTARTWHEAVRKAQRALQDTRIEGVRTNLPILAAIVTHDDFLHGRCDTPWLEAKLDELRAQSHAFISARRDPFHNLVPAHSANIAAAASISASSTLFRKDDAWALALTPQSVRDSAPAQHHLRIERVLRNDFPTSIAAEIAFAAPGSEPERYLLDVRATSASAAALSAQHRRGDPGDPSHVTIPFSGKLVELCVDVGDVVRKGECVAVVQQMKMELEVRSHRDGVVGWVCEAEDGEDVNEGVLAAVIEEEAVGRSKL